MNIKKLRYISTIILINVFIFKGHSYSDAQELGVANSEFMEKSEIIEKDLVTYSASYFDRFKPLTALDMVNQIPGFQMKAPNIGIINNNVRGFSDVEGNILINDRRPSTKQDSLASILARTPAPMVEKIELIKGQVRNIDLRGQPVIVNLILKEGVPTAIQWDAAVRQTFGFGTLAPQGGVSLSDSWSGMDFNLGLRGRRHSIGRNGTENIFNSLDKLLERRLENRENRNNFFIANFNSSGLWNETFIQLNASYNYAKRHQKTDQDRLDIKEGIQEDIFVDHINKSPTFELGIDLERNLSSKLILKGIFLYGIGNGDLFDARTDTASNGTQSLYRVATSDIETQETIGRIELDWSQSVNHIVQANIERAYNVIDSALEQTDDIGAGPIVIKVPGANSRVEEIRWDLLIKDTWTLGRFEVDYGIGAEASTIKQTGDTELERSFFFLKPNFVLSYSLANSNRIRLQFIREIAQLDLEDFVSATEFLDNDVALGNPNIKPERNWNLQLSQEKRFTSDTVVKFTAFHSWITDVMDLLPITSTFEAPGNIGNGRRWGFLWESSLPLDRFGIMAAKLDFKVRWQDSKVKDPVTSKDRMLSNTSLSAGPIFFNVNNKYAYEIDFRQDLQEKQIAWGWDIAERAKQERFKVNELEIYDEGTELGAFIETTQWFGIKIRLRGENLLDFQDTRDRRIFVSERNISPLDTRQFRDRTRGRRLQLTFSGSM